MTKRMPPMTDGEEAERRGLRSWAEQTANTYPTASRATLRALDDLFDAHEDILALRADLARLRASSAALVSKYEERDAALRAENARLRAVADAARALVKCADDDTDDGQGPIVCRKHGGALRTALAALDLPATATGEKGTEHRG